MAADLLDQIDFSKKIDRNVNGDVPSVWRRDAVPRLPGSARRNRHVTPRSAQAVRGAMKRRACRGAEYVDDRPNGFAAADRSISAASAGREDRCADVGAALEAAGFGPELSRLLVPRTDAGLKTRFRRERAACSRDVEPAPPIAGNCLPIAIASTSIWHRAFARRHRRRHDLAGLRAPHAVSGPASFVRSNACISCRSMST